MKTTIVAAACAALLSLSSLSAEGLNLTNDIPNIGLNTELSGWQQIEGVAQYKNADWSQVVGIAHHTSLREAIEIANSNDTITYFFYMSGCPMVLETQEGNYRSFTTGDAVFFAGTPWWGSANGFADGYVKTAE